MMRARRMDRNSEFLVRGSTAHLFSTIVNLHMAHDSYNNDFQGSYLFMTAAKTSLHQWGSLDL